MSAPWVAAHAREAYRALLRLGAEVEPSFPPVGSFAIDAVDIASEGGFCTAVDTLLCATSTSDNRRHVRVQREVRNVRDFAEGRLVREPPRWNVRVWGLPGATQVTAYGPYATRDEALKDTQGVRGGRTWRLVRITRIRRAR